MGKSTPDTHETTSRSEPPEYVRPYIQHAMQSARNLYDTSLYPSTELPGTALEGYQAGADVARSPALIDPAVGLAQRTMGGEFLGADALRGAARAELDDVIGGTRSAFERAGRSDSGLANYALGRGVTAALSPAYQRERGFQQQAMGMAPSLEASRYMPSEQLIGLGMGQRAQEERYYQEPWDRLARYTGLAFGGAPAGLAGTVGTTTQPIYKPSPFSQIAGLGLTAAGMAMGGPWGAALGGLGSGIGGGGGGSRRYM